MTGAAGAAGVALGVAGAAGVTLSMAGAAGVALSLAGTAGVGGEPGGGALGVLGVFTPAQVGPDGVGPQLAKRTSTGRRSESRASSGLGHHRLSCQARWPRKLH